MLEIFRLNGTKPDRHTFALIKEDNYFWFSLDTNSININTKDELSENNKTKVTYSEDVFTIVSNLNTRYEITDDYRSIFRGNVNFDIPVDYELFPRDDIIEILKGVVPEDFI